MDSQELIRLLQAAGFDIMSVRGSHHRLRMGKTTVILPHAKNGLPPGTVNSILRQAGWRT